MLLVNKCFDGYYLMTVNVKLGYFVGTIKGGGGHGTVLHLLQPKLRA